MPMYEMQFVSDCGFWCLQDCPIIYTRSSLYSYLLDWVLQLQQKSESAVMQAQESGEQRLVQDNMLYALDGLCTSSSSATHCQAAGSLLDIAVSKRGRQALRWDHLQGVLSCKVSHHNRHINLERNYEKFVIQFTRFWTDCQLEHWQQESNATDSGKLMLYGMQTQSAIINGVDSVHLTLQLEFMPIFF